MDHLRRSDPLYTENMRKRGIKLVSSIPQVKKKNNATYNSTYTMECVPR
jgi:hypothetical protein